MSGSPPLRAGRAVLAAAIHTIGFVVTESVVEGCEGEPELVVLVDGTPLFVPEGDLMGRNPDELFGPGNPLVPVRGGRRVVLRSEPDWEQGPHIVEVFIQLVGSRVVWQSAGADVLPRTSPAHPFLVFDRSEYVAAVDQFDRERPVSHQRATSERFAALLAQHPDVVASFGYRIDAVVLSTPGGVPVGQVQVKVSKRHHSHRRHTITIAVPVGPSPELAAEKMVQRLTDFPLWAPVKRTT